MKKKINTTKRVIAVLMISFLMFGFAACSRNQKLSGTYVPEHPDASGVVFTSLEFDGRTVHVEAAGSSIGLDYVIKDGVFSFEDNFTFNIGGEAVPTSFSFVQNDESSFTLDGIKYVAE